jgi:hypothetical protein
MALEYERKPCLVIYLANGLIYDASPLGASSKIYNARTPPQYMSVETNSMHDGLSLNGADVNSLKLIYLV